LVRSDVAFVLLTMIFCCMDFVYHAMLASDSGKKAFVFLCCKVRLRALLTVTRWRARASRVTSAHSVHSSCS
jgi:hypothetical protein